METGGRSAGGGAGQSPLKPSLVEWKLVLDSQTLTSYNALKPSLVEWKPKNTP